MFEGLNMTREDAEAMVMKDNAFSVEELAESRRLGLKGDIAFLGGPTEESYRFIEDAENQRKFSEEEKRKMLDAFKKKHGL